MSFSLYGLVIGISVVVAELLFEANLRRELEFLGISTDVVEEEGKDGDKIFLSMFKLNILFAIPGMIVGARLYHVFCEWSYYSSNPSEIIKTWAGGVSIVGLLWGLFISQLVLVLGKFMVGICILLFGKYQKWKKGTSLNLFFWKDEYGLGVNILTDFRFLGLLAPAVSLAQAIGRIGNYFNQELYGPPTSELFGVTWGLYIPEGKRISGLESFSFFHPVFLYEMILNVSNFVLLQYLFVKRKIRSLGLLWCIYLFNYAVIRTLIDLMRIDEDWLFFPFKIQGVSVWILFFLSVFLLILKKRRSR